MSIIVAICLSLVQLLSLRLFLLSSKNDSKLMANIGAWFTHNKEPLQNNTGSHLGPYIVHS